MRTTRWTLPSKHEQATLMQRKQAGPALRDVRPRTRSIARGERLVIPSSLDISDSEEEHDGQDHTSYFVPKSFGLGAPKSVAATEKVTGTARHRIPFAPKNISNRDYSSDRILLSAIYRIHFCDDSQMTPTSSSKKPRITSTNPSQINSAPRNGSANEDSDVSSGVGPPELISCSSDDADM